MSDAPKNEVPVGPVLTPGTNLDGWTIEGATAGPSPAADYYRVNKEGQTGWLKVHRQKGAIRDKALGRLIGFDHRGLLRLWSWGSHEGFPWEVSEPRPGPVLEGRLSEGELVHLVRSLNDTLKACHGAGILHRNLRTTALFRRDADWALGEFGSVPQPTLSAGYSAPETYSGVVGPEVDYYSLGVLVWEAATGAVAFAGQNPQFVIRDTIGGQAVDQLWSRPESTAVSAAVRPLIDGLLTTRHDRRWGAAHVETWLADQAQETDPMKARAAEATETTIGPETWSQTFVDALVEGSRVYLKGGTYAGGVVLSKPIHLAAARPQEPAVFVPGAAAEHQPAFALTIAAPGAGSLVGLAFRGEDFSNHGLLSIQDGAWVVQGCELRGAYSLGLQIVGAATAPQVSQCRIYGGNTGVLVDDGATPVLDHVDVLDHIRNNVLVQGKGTSPEMRHCRSCESKQCGIVVTKGASGLYEDCEFRANSLANVTVRDLDTNPVFRNNTIADGRRGGVYVLDNAEGTFEGNDVYGNASVNVEVKDSGSEPRFKANKIHDGKQGGISVYGGGGGHYEGNEIFGNALANVAVYQAGTLPEFKRNRVHDGKQSGFSISGGAGGDYEGNEVFGNAQANVIIFQTGTNPAFLGNKVYAGRQGGFFIHGGATGQYEDNEVFDNALANVEVLDAGTNPTFRKNRIHACLNEGLFVQNGASGRFEGNEFTGNGFSTKGLKDAGPGYPSIRIQGSGTSPTFRENRVTGFAAAAFEISKGAGGVYEGNILQDIDKDNGFAFDKLWDVKWGTSPKRRGNTGD